MLVVVKAFMWDSLAVELQLKLHNSMIVYCDVVLN